MEKAVALAVGLVVAVYWLYENNRIKTQTLLTFTGLFFVAVLLWCVRNFGVIYCLRHVVLPSGIVGGLLWLSNAVFGKIQRSSEGDEDL